MTQPKIGLCIIGDEILSGKRQDKHFTNGVETLKEWGLKIDWVRILGDDVDLLTENFRQMLASGDHFFSFGGIGATPDDMTRACFAEAAGVELAIHDDARAEIEAQFGEEAYPQRIKMAELPVGSRIIPNPFNRVPGFSYQNCHFLPGFPQMAWPMMKWVLEQEYNQYKQGFEAEFAVKIPNFSESKLVDYMKAFGDKHPEVKLFSLPHISDDERSVEFGMKGGKSVLNQLVDEFLEGLSNIVKEFQVLS